MLIPVSCARDMSFNHLSFSKKPGVMPGFFCLALCLLLSACHASPENRSYRAQEIATTGGLVSQDVLAPPFTLRTYSRFNAPASGVVRVYIEGDGFAWMSRSQISADPTPKVPVALALAAIDPAPNVIYIARPCQYIMYMNSNIRCPSVYWGDSRFSREVVDSVNFALEKIKQQHGLRKIELVGYSGGAAVAVLLAASRNDIVSLRTVAGNLDTGVFTDLHKVSPISGSLNPRDVAHKISALPQIHFIGGADKIVPVEVYEGYSRAAGVSTCRRHQVVTGMAHDLRWQEEWLSLLQEEPVCK